MLDVEAIQKRIVDQKQAQRYVPDGHTRPQPGHIHLVVGPPSSGKTSQLVSEAAESWSPIVRAGGMAKQDRPVRYFVHESARHKDGFTTDISRAVNIDTSRIAQSDPERISFLVRDGHTRLLLIDDAHLFPATLASICEDLATNRGVHIIVAGQAQDATGVPNPTVVGLLAFSDKVSRRLVECSRCFRAEGQHKFQTSASENFEMICRSCWSMGIQLGFPNRGNGLGPTQRRPAGKLTVISGPVRSGKTAEFSRRIDTATTILSPNHVRVFVPSRWPQQSELAIGKFRNMPTPRLVDSVAQVVNGCSDFPAAVFIESVHAMGDFGPESVEDLNQLVDMGVNITCTLREVGLDGNPFSGAGELLAKADQIGKFSTRCGRCHRLGLAVRSFCENFDSCSPQELEYARTGKIPVCRECYAKGLSRNRRSA